MLSISPLSGGDQGYYLALTNTNYYVESGEPLGEWRGLAAQALGLEGFVEKEHLERLCNGYHHLTEKALVQNAGVLEGDKARKPGDDMTFSADKTVSAIFGATDDQTLRDGIRDAHKHAVITALNLAQDRAGFARIGRNGQSLVFAPLLWSLFEHGTSRAGDPQLHTHALLLNLTVLENGKTRTLDSTHIYHWKMALGAVYRAEMARGMQKLGFEVEQYEQGSSVFYRVIGVPEALCDFWSKRRAEIEEKLKLDVGSLDSATARCKEIATLATRRKKEDERPRCEMHQTWQVEAREFGFTPEFIQSIRTPYQQLTPEMVEKHKADIWRQALAKLSYHQAYWSEADMTKMVAERSAGKLSAGQVRELIANKVHSPELIVKGQLVTREKNNLEHQYLARSEQMFTTPQILAYEKKLIERVQSMQQTPSHEPDKRIVQDVLKKYPTIEPEQKKAVELLVSGGPIRLLSGTAGTGKGFCLKVCADIWAREGREVIGIADAGRTERRLEEDTGIKSQTMAMALIRLQSGRLTLKPNTTIVVDEAGMLGTIPFAKLLEHADQAKARVVYAGDGLQLQPVLAGAPYKMTAKMLGKENEATLVDIRRQDEKWARDVVHDAKAGRSAEALAKFIEHKQFVLTDTRREAMQKLVEQWVRDGGIENPERVLMIASLNHEAKELSLLAQSERIRAGLVDPDKKLYANGVFFHVGDKLQFKHPSKFYDIVNGDTATVLGVDPDRNRLIVKVDRDAREVEINLSPQSKRYSPNHLRLSYAQTTYAAQGATIPHCHVLLGGPMTDLHTWYVQVSRSKISTYLFVNKQDAGPELKDIVRSLAKNRQKKMAHEVFRPEEVRPQEKEQKPRVPKPPRLQPSDFQDLPRQHQKDQSRAEEAQRHAEERARKLDRSFGLSF